MKKALLIATTLMTLSLPAHAAQMNQADQADANEQIKTATTTSLVCVYKPRPYCR